MERLPPYARKGAWKGYQDAFECAYNSEEIEHKKTNAGRRSANLWLREYVKNGLRGQL